MFVLSKIGWTIGNPATLLVLALALGVVLLGTRWRRAGVRLVTAVAAMLVFVSVVPVGAMLVAVLEDRFPRPTTLPRVDGIVVLSGFVNVDTSVDRGQTELNTYVDRLTTFMALAREHPRARLVISSGSASVFDGRPKEADLIADLLTDVGFPMDRVELERTSRNTCENARDTFAQVKPAADQVWVVVTSAFHMPRTMACFRAVGWDVVPYPTDFQTGGLGGMTPMLSPLEGLAALNLAAHEFIGLAAYRLAGMTGELWPAP